MGKADQPKKATARVPGGHAIPELLVPRWDKLRMTSRKTSKRATASVPDVLP